MNKLFVEDYERFTPHKFSYVGVFIRLIRNHELRYIFWGRQRQDSRKNYVMTSIHNFILHAYRRKYGLELNFENVGGEFV